MQGFKRGTVELTQEEIDEIMKSSPHLEKQHYSQIANLSPLSREVISR